MKLVRALTPLLAVMTVVIGAACTSDDGDEQAIPPADTDLVVTSSADAGQGSLRAAIDQANNEVIRPGSDRIVFDFAAMDDDRMVLASQLPISLLQSRSKARGGSRWWAEEGVVTGTSTWLAPSRVGMVT